MKRRVGSILKGRESPNGVEHQQLLTSLMLREERKASMDILQGFYDTVDLAHIAT